MNAPLFVWKSWGCLVDSQLCPQSHNQWLCIFFQSRRYDRISFCKLQVSPKYKPRRLKHGASLFASYLGQSTTSKVSCRQNHIIASRKIQYQSYQIAAKNAMRLEIWLEVFFLGLRGLAAVCAFVFSVVT